MTYQIKIEARPEYIYATVTGSNNPETVMSYMADVLAACEQEDCYRVLIDEQLEGPRLSTMDVFAIASEGSERALGRFEALAYVDREMGQLGEFLETVAVNRCVPLAFFPDSADAERWLEERTPGSSHE
jgi:hypothetical protein